MHTVIRWYCAGEYWSVGGKSQRDRRDDVFENDAIVSDGIDVGSGFVWVAVTTEIIGAAGVDADEDDILYVFYSGVRLV